MLPRLMTNFIIVSVPDKISFLCPYCYQNVEIKWRDLNPPESWSDDWDNVICPECGEEIALGDWVYD